MKRFIFLFLNLSHWFFHLYFAHIIYAFKLFSSSPSPGWLAASWLVCLSDREGGERVWRSLVCLGQIQIAAVKQKSVFVVLWSLKLQQQTWVYEVKFEISGDEWTTHDTFLVRSQPTAKVLASQKQTLFSRPHFCWLVLVDHHPLFLSTNFLLSFSTYKQTLWPFLNCLNGANFHNNSILFYWNVSNFRVIFEG